MNQILAALLLSFAIAVPAASAATVRSNPVPAAPARTVPTAASQSTPAVSADSAKPARVAPADKTHWFYIGAQLGDSVVGALVGLQFNKIYSLEVRYDYVDPIYQPNITVNSSSAGIAGVALFPLNLSNMEPLFIFAKAGYERTKDTTTTYDPGIPGLFPPTTTVTTILRKRVTVGGGTQYDFNNNVSGRIGVNFIGSDHSVYLSAIYKL